jgi:hypothetical protein
MLRLQVMALMKFARVIDVDALGRNTTGNPQDWELELICTGLRYMDAEEAERALLGRTAAPTAKAGASAATNGRPIGFRA